jgi:pimeloyl-ACP methyl ester carboxylesterase
MSLPGKTMRIGGYNYHVSDQGEGDKVAMLVHGMPDDGSCWKYQAPALLNAGYRVIVPDTLGYGGTDRPVEVEHYKLEGIIDHMFEIIDTLGLKDINLMGHDWGSAITWPMILRRPELFRKYISMSVGHIGAFYGQAFSTPERMYECCMRNWYMYMHALDGMEELYMRNDFEFFKIFFCQHPEAEKVIAAIKETGRIEWLNYDRANHVTQDYLAYAKDPEGFGPRCKVPVMVMFPEDDMFLWKTQAIDTPSLMDAECRIEIIQGGHWSMLDHPDDVNKLMLEWFESEASTARADVKEA